MITGDARQVAYAVASALGVDEVFAEVKPADKDATVASLQASGHRVAMVGDGVNDAPALARADGGIAIGAGTDVAIASAGVVLASDTPAVVGVIDLSEASYRKMVQNLVWATAYNVASIPVAAGVFAFAGLTLPPAVAALAMSLSTIVVAANAQLLRRLDLRPARGRSRRRAPARRGRAGRSPGWRAGRPRRPAGRLRAGPRPRPGAGPRPRPGAGPRPRRGLGAGAVFVAATVEPNAVGRR